MRTDDGSHCHTRAHPLLCHAKSPRRSSATSLTHTDSPGHREREERREGRGAGPGPRLWGHDGSQQHLKNIKKNRRGGGGGIRGSKAGKRYGGHRCGGVGRVAGAGRQSVLYSHSLSPLWNRSMKWHSPVQGKKSEETGDERRYSRVYISPPARSFLVFFFVGAMVSPFESHGYIPSA